MKAARIAAGFASARDAAKAKNWNESTYRGHEAGPREISKRAAFEYARAFGVSVAWLLAGENERGTANAQSADQQNRGARLSYEAIGLRVLPIVDLGALEEMRTPQKHRLNAIRTGQVAVADAELIEDSFAVVVEDNSCVCAGDAQSMSVGELAVINPGANLVPGKLVIAGVPGEKRAILRRYRVEDDVTITLVAVNPDFPKKSLAKREVLFVWPVVGAYRRL